jgi:hypothetical protein
VLALGGLTGCVGEEEVAGSMEALREGGRLTAREAEALYPQTQTVIGPRVEVEGLTQAAVRGNASDATTVIDATEGRSIFPMPAEIRQFRDQDDIASTLATELGRVVEGPNTGEQHGTLRGSYAMHGSSFWTDPRTDVRYRVSDPIAARIGGITGQFDVDGERLCIDPDGRCADGERASYLEPEGSFTAPTHAYINGTGGVTATFHTFFNKTYFPWPWARHGNRTEIDVSALPSTRLTASGYIEAYYNGGDWQRADMPSSTVNHHEVEVALWTGVPGNVIFDASAACGWGSVYDPDVSGSRRTGNGPDNSLRCPG